MCGTEVFLSVFLMGLFGSGHCIGMCGGIMGVFSAGIDQQGSVFRRNLLVLSYNIGRIATYTIAGAVAGTMGIGVLGTLAPEQAHTVMTLISGMFLIALGLYLSAWWQGLLALERLGSRLWRLLEPLGRRLVPVGNSGQAIAAGLVWGWLPCGMVYSALMWSLTTGSTLDGALLMASFGAGTLPAMLAFGASAQSALNWLRRNTVRRTVGAIMIILGVSIASGLVDPGTASHDHGEHAGTGLDGPTASTAKK